MWLCGETTEYVQQQKSGMSKHESSASLTQPKQHECGYINRTVETQTEGHTDTQAGVQSPPLQARR